MATVVRDFARLASRCDQRRYTVHAVLPWHPQPKLPSCGDRV